MKLETNWTAFLSSVNSLIEEATKIEKLEKETTTENQLLSIREDINSWKKQCFDYLNTSFDTEKNEFAIGFYNAREQRFNLGKKDDLSKKIKNEFSDLKAKKSTLRYYLRILSISDAIIKPNEINLKERAKYSTEEILDLILEKLYELYDDYYHSVGMILEGNGIIPKRHGEDREYIKILENQDLVKVVYTRNITAQLTAEGKIYVENMRKIESTDYSQVSDTQTEINNKIDDIINQLNKLGLGQEIIFDELSEMKDLYGKLDKKNWGQLLKGKLIDLGLSQVVNKEVLNLIYKELTQEILKLI
jgi:hypothetical protein